MKETRAHHLSGTRADLVARLEDMAIGWYHLAKDRQSEACRRGAEQLRLGADSVTVGHTVYEVEAGAAHA